VKFKQSGKSSRPQHRNRATWVDVGSERGMSGLSTGSSWPNETSKRGEDTDRQL
jgi:hypothetical protein